MLIFSGLRREREQWAHLIAGVTHWYQTWPLPHHQWQSQPLREKVRLSWAHRDHHCQKHPLASHKQGISLSGGTRALLLSNLCYWWSPLNVSTDNCSQTDLPPPTGKDLRGNRVQEVLPELTFTPNPLRHLEFGVEVVVGASHLPDADPVLSLEGELQGAPAEAGGQIHDEAHHVGQGNDINIPERMQKTKTVIRSYSGTFKLFSFLLLQTVATSRITWPLSTCACPTKPPRSLWSEARPWSRSHHSFHFPTCSFCGVSPWCWETACKQNGRLL